MSSFILDNLDEILAEWEAFARTLKHAGHMDALALRDHARTMLEAIAKDIQTAQSESEQKLKSKGMDPGTPAESAAATSHGALRHTVGFDLVELVAEFRALRATVLRLWIAKEGFGDPKSAYEMMRFNEGIDEALADSVESYSKELAKSRDTFIAIVGHDLRSPLGAMSGAVTVLEGPPNEQTRVRALAAAKRSVTAMEAMIGDLIDYTRSRLGKAMPIVPRPADLGEVCRTAVDEVSHAVPGAPLQFDSEGTLDGVFDADRMRQVVSNLLNNAVQHGRRGTPITLLAKGTSHALILQVSNQGPVLAEETLARMFEPLVQGDSPDASAKPATNLGLGLYIARAIVAAHGGRIEAASDPAGVTTFVVELPRLAKDAPPTKK
ncbi:MAG TPA: HAMP domain-containing sensor histidine kinase [Usitatibacter sp.]|nr:HAMP domain-containing sensor histidine kinase [Usitatibacter sp.]